MADRVSIEVKPMEKEVVKEKNSFKDDIKTTTRKFKDIVKEFAEKSMDKLTLETRLPVKVRMKHRLKALIALGKAKHMKIKGQWYTEPPELHLRGPPVAKLLNESEAEIFYEIYDQDEEGNKKFYKQFAEKEMLDGTMRQVVAGGEYRIRAQVKEYIREGKPIEREIDEFDLGGN